MSSMFPELLEYLDTNFSGKAQYALSSLKERDFVLVHVEAPDEAGHMGNIEAKIKAISDFDEKVVGGMLNELGGFGDYKIMVLPDHPTPISIRTHTRDPVPLLFILLPKARIMWTGLMNSRQKTVFMGS